MWGFLRLSYPFDPAIRNGGQEGQGMEACGFFLTIAWLASVQVISFGSISSVCCSHFRFASFCHLRHCRTTLTNLILLSNGTQKPDYRKPRFNCSPTVGKFFLMFFSMLEVIASFTVLLLSASAENRSEKCSFEWASMIIACVDKILIKCKPRRLVVSYFCVFSPTRPKVHCRRAIK